jgi:hypothetical protein
MATGSSGLLTARAALGATEAASTTPTRLMYFGAPSNIDTTGLQQFETIEDRLAWAKADGLRNLYNGMESNTFRVSSVPASYEDFGFVLATVPGVVSGAGTGAGTPTTTDTSAYTRTFTPSQTVTAYGATGGYDMFLEVGPNDLVGTVAQSVAGLRVSEWALHFNRRASGTDTGCSYDMTWMSHKAEVDITAFTGSLSDRTQTLALGTQFKAYIDTSTMGSTADTEVIAADFTYSRPPTMHPGADGTGNYTSMHFPNQVQTHLSITRKFSNKTELNAYTAKTLRKVRLLCEGGLIGAVSAKNTIQLDFIGKTVGHQVVDVDGIWYATLELDGLYDSTQLASWKVTTISTVSAAYTTA